MLTRTYIPAQTHKQDYTHNLLSHYGLPIFVRGLMFDLVNCNNGKYENDHT